MDGKRIDGRYIYTYPLARAQREGYFRTVNFVAVIEYDDADADDAIAARAGQQLRKDREAGLDHLLMARVKTTDRADEILKLYDSRFPEFEAVAIHTVSDISAYGTDWGDCVTEDFWLIVVTEGNEDEAEIGEFEKRCRDGRAGYPA